MAKPLPSTDAAPNYLDFYGMSRPPFARLSAPADIFYSDQCSLLNSYLAGASEQPDRLVVLCGVEGAGKTTLLNQYIAGLDEDACYATFDESCLDGTQFYCSFLMQIGFGEISGSLRELRRITREFLLHRGKDGDPILFFVDNAQLIRPSVLEQIRWICETKIGSDRVLSLVLAGNLNLPRIMESPAMSSIKFRNQTNFHIRVCTESETDDYVRHRLSLAGASDSAKFSDDSRALIYRFTGGVPGLINKLCNEVLAEAFAQNTRVVTEQIIRKVAETHHIMPHVVPLKGKGRRGSDTDKAVDLQDENAGERISGREPEKSAANIDAMQAILKSDAEVKELQTQLAKLQEQLQSVEEDKNRSSQQIAERDKQIKDLRSQLADASTKSKELSKTMSSSSSELAKLKAGLSEARNLLKEGAEASERSASEITALENQLSTERKESQKLHAEIERNDAIICQLTDDLARSEAALSAAERKHSEKIGELENLNKEIVASEKQAQKLLVAAEKRHAAAEKRAETMSRDLKNLQSDINSSVKEVAELGEIVDSKDAENDRLRTALSASDKSLAKYRAKVDRLAADLDKWEASKSDEVISDLREQLAVQAKELDDVLSEESTKDEEIGVLKGALETLEKNLAKKDKTAKTTTNDLKKERRKLKRANSELSEAVDKYAELEHRNDELQDIIETLNADIGVAENNAKEAAVLRQSLEILREECGSLQEQVDAMESLQDAISDKDRRIAELEAQVSAQEKAASTVSRGAKTAGKVLKSVPHGKGKVSAAVQSIEIYRQGKMLQAINAHNGPSRLMVGRARDSDLRLNSKFVSRHHAFLFCTPERMYVEDLNSSNGIIVNGQKVGRADLSSEDKIVIGDFQIVLKDG